MLVKILRLKIGGDVPKANAKHLPRLCEIQNSCLVGEGSAKHYCQDAGRAFHTAWRRSDLYFELWLESGLFCLNMFIAIIRAGEFEYEIV